MDDLDALIARLKELIDLASDGLIADLSKHAEFQAIMEELLTRYHIAAYMLGADTDTVSEEARRVVVAGVARQLAFLERFVVEIQSEEEFRAGWAARARSYAESVKVPYWQGKVKMLPLPSLPGDGTTQCLQNCRCEWEIDKIENGDYHAYWRLSAVEHCQTCTQRAAEWSPIVIEAKDVPPESSPNAVAPSPPLSPNGAPISNFLELPAGKQGERLRGALDAIDKVHGVKFPFSERIPMFATRDRKRGGAYYGQSGSGGAAIRIEVSFGGSYSKYPLASAVHEIGHMIDHQGLGARGTYASGDRAYQRNMQKWRDVVASSRAVTNLRERTASSNRGAIYASYALQDYELWARAYAQYIVTKSGDPALLREFNEWRQSTWDEMQWDDDDFAPIMEEMDAIFLELGWLQ